MPFLPLLMRMLLCLSLVLNGTGQAVASAGIGMQLHAGGHGHATSAAGHAHAHQPVAASHCDGSTAKAGAAHLHGATDACAKVAGDCCAHGDCQHACHPQHSPAAHLGLALSEVVFQSQDARRALPAIHDAPAPLRLIRPPIA